MWCEVEMPTCGNSVANNEQRRRRGDELTFRGGRKRTRGTESPTGNRERVLGKRITRRSCLAHRR